MSANHTVSAFRVEKNRSHATLRLSNNDTPLGCFFVSGSSSHLHGPERVGELLNAESGFFPFEVRDDGAPRTMLVNRAHVLTVELADNEARQASGYDVATRRMVALHLSNGDRVVGAVRVYRPEGRDRLSDWARQSEQFRYLETDQTALLVNVAHVIEISEVIQP